jgi:ABC-type multidrug transport system fused ATPase/permease subunit
LHRRFTAARERQAGIVTVLVERLPNLRLIRAFGQERAEVERLGESLGDHADACRRTLRVSALQSAIAVTVAGIGAAAVIVVGAAVIQLGGMTTGTLLSFSALSALLYAPIVRLAQFQAGLAATRVALERMLELLDEPETKESESLLRPEIKGRVTVQDVSFQYGSAGPAILQDVSFELRPGQTLAIAGASGSGKSTLLAILANLYRVDRGSVRLDGEDTADWPREVLRKSVALVPQRPLLFEGTIRSNLSYAAPDAPEHRLWEVLEAVCLGELVRSRPDGLDAPLGPGGAGLSGGQRQRLALARAVLTEPRLLLLDDCTSALDAETEATIWRHLNQLLPGATRVIVSHKPAVLALADHVLVLNSDFGGDCERPR